MTHAIFEGSRFGGQPVTLVLFAYSGGEFAYTTGDAPVSFGGRDYQPVAIDHGRVQSRGDAEPDGQIVGITVPLDNPVAALFLVYPPSEAVTVTIREGHIGGSEFPVKWTGGVNSVVFDKKDAVIKCEPVILAFDRSGFDRRYSVQCQYPLYDPSTCKANKAAATIVRTVIASDTTSITLQESWAGAVPVSKYLNGEVNWQNSAGAIEARRVISVTQTTLTLSAPVRDLAAGSNVNIILGCNRKGVGGDCETLHNNLANFGGQPWQPTDNPFVQDKFT